MKVPPVLTEQFFFAFLFCFNGQIQKLCKSCKKKKKKKITNGVLFNVAEYIYLSIRTLADTHCTQHYLMLALFDIYGQ